MKLSYKAALYSAVVFPGSGYFFVDAKMKAWLSMLLCLSCFSILMMDAFHKAQVLVEKIVLGEIPYDLLMIRSMISSIDGVVPKEVMFCSYAIISFVWLASSVECYLKGRRLDRLNECCLL